LFEVRKKAKGGEKNPKYMNMLVYIHMLPLYKDGARGTDQPPL
jgi:hypothetical protein